ncbi:KOW motif-containing protein [Candidatus Saccharibacteria bacterium]|nr:KOW motif-containing protein [Candidatus Saccharibacteria bacterium]
MKSLKVNDEVMIIAGSHKGKKATIVKIDRKANKAMLEGIGVVERHMKKTYYNPAGGKKTIHVGIDMSNLKLVKAGEAKKAAKTKKADKKSKKGAK